MQEIEGSLRKLGSFDIRATETGGTHSQMQGLGNKRILRVVLGVREDFTG